MTTHRRSATLLTALLTLAGLVVAVTPSSASAGSSGGVSETTANCVAYASGTGMGSFCLGGGGGAQTLRERFGKQEFDRCRYSDVPPGIETPFNPSPDEGRWYLRKCINYIDWDTVTGGNERQINVHLAYLPNDFDTTYNDTPVSNFLWGQLERTTQFPVPYLEAHPTTVPRVGVPTYFTFRWMDPATDQPVAEGPFAGQEDGGPYVELDNPNGIQMRARARFLRVDPRQNDMQQITCPTVDPQYDEQAGPAGDQPDSCSLTFPRSSASAKERMTATDRDIAGPLGDVYLVRVIVVWEVEYSRDGQNWTLLGRGQQNGAERALLQSTDQPMPVRESQASNLPPRFTLQ